MSPQSQERLSVRRHRLPHVETYDVTADELNQIENESMQVGQDFQFASISFTAGISFLVALLTTTNQSPKVFAAFLVVIIIGFVFSLYFGGKWYRGRTTGKSVIQKIREREIGPLGEEGKEIKPTELADLPSQEAGGAQNQ